MCVCEEVCVGVFAWLCVGVYVCVFAWLCVWLYVCVAEYMVLSDRAGPPRLGPLKLAGIGTLYAL